MNDQTSTQGPDPPQHTENGNNENGVNEHTIPTRKDDSKISKVERSRTHRPKKRPPKLCEACQSQLNEDILTQANPHAVSNNPQTRCMRPVYIPKKVVLEGQMSETRA